ncbi:MAG: hypothetical protein JXJ04_25625 [Spirochaetales bacterium]|nr:hypothetical protein [Spirochaetales bacterium]
MADLNVAMVSEGGVELKTAGTTIFISGCINHPKPGNFMEPFIESVHSAIIEKGIKEIIVDITDLRFLNSAGIRELVDWVMKLNSLPEDKIYKIKFLCSSEHKWQESSMSTLIYLNPDHTSKETV